MQKTYKFEKNNPGTAVNLLLNSKAYAKLKNQNLTESEARKLNYWGMWTVKQTLHKNKKTLKSTHAFFISGFSFTNINKSQHSRWRGGAIHYLLATTSTCFTDIETLASDQTQTGNTLFLSASFQPPSYTHYYYTFSNKKSVICAWRSPFKPLFFWQQILSFHVFIHFVSHYGF